MRVSKEQVERNRDRVVDVAGRLFREKGVDGVGLNELMQAAGLTRGAFYGHFESKDDLAAQACRRAMEETVAYWRKLAADSAGDPLRVLTDFFLSDWHCDSLGNGCAMAAMGGDAVRQEPAFREAYADGVRGFLSVLHPFMSGSPSESRQEAIVSLSMMVGALLLSRAVGDEELSREIRQAAENGLLRKHGQ